MAATTLVIFFGRVCLRLACETVSGSGSGN